MNDYFNHDSQLVPGTKARAEDVNSRFNSIEAGFDKLPAPHPTENGFSGAVYVGDPTLPGHAITIGKAMSGEVWFAECSGVANSYVLNMAVNPDSYAVGLTITFTASATNTGSSTVTIGALGVKNLYRFNTTPVQAGDIVEGSTYTIIYDGSRFVLSGTTQKQYDDLETSVSIHASNAEANANSAASSASSASSSASSASSSASAAYSFSADAGSSASAASASASSASSSATTASGYSNSANNSATNAESFATLAQGFASDAQTSANNASSSATSAANSASSANTSATTATGAVVDCGSSLSQANSARDDAQLFASQCFTWAGNAETSKNEAETAAATATTQAGNASSSATSAANSASSAASIVAGINDASIGIYQNWTDVTASRVIDVTYTNNTDKPIFVSVRLTGEYISAGELFVDGVSIQQFVNRTSESGYIRDMVCAIVPPGSTYSAGNGTTTATIASWMELR